MRLIQPPGGLPWALYAICGSSLLLNLVLGFKLVNSPEVDSVPPLLTWRRMLYGARRLPRQCHDGGWLGVCVDEPKVERFKT